jgi:hypothetical protein
MAESDRQGVGRVRRFREFRQGQQCAHHHLHLAFVGMTITGDRGFHFARGVAMDGKIVLRSSQKDYSTDFGEAEGGANVERAEDGLDCHCCGREFLDQIAQTLVNILQARACRFLAAVGVGAEGTIVEHGAPATVAFHNAEASGSGGGGVYTQYADMPAGLLLNVHGVVVYGEARRWGRFLWLVVRGAGGCWERCRQAKIRFRRGFRRGGDGRKIRPSTRIGG